MKKALLAGLILGVVMMAGCGAETTEETSVSQSVEVSASTDTVTKTEIKEVYVPTLPTGVEDSDIYVAPVEGISDDFYRGVDISTVLIEEASGAKYKNQNGEEEDLFKILADNGVNSVRVRVWNDPYDENGNPYGGGNCDVKTAVEIGARAAQYGIKLLVDFHYSDFWADPSKQMAPKAWADMSAAEKAVAAHDFTLDALKQIIDGGAVVWGVQVGNETNNGMSGEKLYSSMTDIMKGGINAVHEINDQYGTEIKTIVHFTNPEDKSKILSIAEKLKNYDVDYDIFGFSYYPYWHGTMENLQATMSAVKEKYGKDVMCVENSYLHTEDDGDGTSNSVSGKDTVYGYAATVQGQASEVRDVIATVVAAGGIGYFYWEPAWIPVNENTWEKGSGWATSFAGAYDPKDAGMYYGGCAWDNQAMFDFSGTALSSLSVFKYLKYGTNCEAKVEYAEDATLDVLTGEDIVLPEGVYVHYNNASLNSEAKVTWNENDINNMDKNVPGEYTIRGILEDGTEVKCTVKIAGLNILPNPSFEESDTSMWNFIYEGTDVLDFQRKPGDAHTGEVSLHYWRAGAVEFKAETTLTGLENGKYIVSCYAQGGDSGSNPEMYLYANAGGKEYKDEFKMNGWINWQHPEIEAIEVTDGTLTIGVSVTAGAGAWGTFDDFYVSKQD